MNFVHLDVKTHASFQKSSIKPDRLVEHVKALGQSAVAVTDYGNVFHAISFYRAAVKNGIKPIMGAEVFVTLDNAESRDQNERQVWHLILLAENNDGWQNICRLLSDSNTDENFWYKNRVDLKMLREHSDGVICLSGGTFDSLVSYHLYDKLDDEGQVVTPKARFKADALVRQLISVFGNDRFFLQVQDHGHQFQQGVNEELRRLAAKNGVGCVASNNPHFMLKEHFESHRTLLRMGFDKYNPTTRTDFNEEFYVKSRDEMEQLSLLPRELDLTQEIADRCNVEIDLKKRRLPVYPFLEKESAAEKLRGLVRDGFSVRGLESEEEKARVEKELSDIHEMGFDDYFLIVADVCSWIRRNGIPMGHGRGSAGGSLVSYCLGITDINPLDYGLLWERFLNKGRGGLPDIDTDVPRSRRKEVLEYIQSRFGANSVAQIVTFNGMKARAVLKEVLHVYGVPFEDANAITRLIPTKNEDHTAITLDQAIEKVPELQEYEKKYRSWFAIARELEGCYKSLGTHAAAVVISDVPFSESDYPLCRAADGKSLIFAYDMQTVDTLSLLKLDILGLTTLDDISVATELIYDRYRVRLSRSNLPLDDPDTYDLIGTGRVAGMFQIEKQLGKIWAKQLKPKNIEELSDLVSIIRPGPLDSGMADTYRDVKSGKMLPVYLHPSLKPILDKTYSGCLYQEQVMAICSIVAGFSLYDADNVRKAMGKKKHEEMEKWKQRFIDGCGTTSGVAPDVALSMWEFIEKFAGYGFNKSHGIGYGLLAYETGYIKAHYPLEFFCSKLRNARHAPDEAEEIHKLINDAKLFDIEVVPPRVSLGNTDFDIVDENTIAFGLASLKGVGAKALAPIRRIQKMNLTANSFLWSCFEKSSGINKTVVHALIKSGALDDLGVDRVKMLNQYTLLSQLTVKERELLSVLCSASGVDDWIRPLRGLADEDGVERIKSKYEDEIGKLRLPNVRRREKIRELLCNYDAGDFFDSQASKVAWEIHYLGISLSGNPADVYNAPDKCRDVMKFPSADRRVELIVTIESVREIVTRKPPPRPMAFVTAGDNTYSLDNIVVFPKVFEEVKPLLEAGTVVRIRGNLDNRGSVLVKRMERLR